LLISASGHYKLIMCSDKPEARKFQDWVTREVLPPIRKDGIYVAAEEKAKTGECRRRCQRQTAERTK
jgi:prophage antirepressor-like protein